MWPFGDNKTKQPAAADSTQEAPESDEDYIYQGLRKDHPDLADVDDDVLLQAVHDTEFSDINDYDVFKQALHDTYVPKKMPTANFAAATDTSKTQQQPSGPAFGNTGMLGEGLRQVGKFANDLGTSAWHNMVVDPIKGPAQALGAAGAFGQTPLNQSLDELESMPDYQELRKRGYGPKIAKHLVEQRASTMQDISGENTQALEHGKDVSVEGAATALSTAATMGTAGALGLAAKGAGTALGLSEEATQALTQKGLGKVVTHAIDGALGLSGYYAVKAAAEGKSASEIYDAGLHGDVPKDKQSLMNSPVTQGAAMGALLPVAAKPVWNAAKGLGRAVMSVGPGITRYVERQGSKAAAAQLQALTAQVDTFVNTFQSDWLRTRFEDFIRGYDGQPPTVAANALIQRVLGNDALENSTAESIQNLAEKIKTQRRYIGIEPGMGTMKPSDAPVPVTGMQTSQQAMQGMMQLPEPTPQQVIEMLSTPKLQMEPQHPYGDMGGGLAPEPMVNPQESGMKNIGEFPGEQERAMGATPLSQDAGQPEREFIGTFDTWAPKRELAETPMERIEPPYAPEEKGPMAPLDLPTNPNEPVLSHKPLTSDSEPMQIDRGMPTTSDTKEGPPVKKFTMPSAPSDYVVPPARKSKLTISATDGKRVLSVQATGGRTNADAAHFFDKEFGPMKWRFTEAGNDVQTVEGSTPNANPKVIKESKLSKGEQWSPTNVNKAEVELRSQKLPKTKEELNTKIDEIAQKNKLTSFESSKLHERFAGTKASFGKSPAIAPITQKLPYIPDKPITAEKYSNEWFAQSLENLRDTYQDLPKTEHTKYPFDINKLSSEEKNKPTSLEMHNMLAEYKNKRKSNWFGRTMGTIQALAMKHADDPEWQSLGEQAEAIGQYRSERTGDKVPAFEGALYNPNAEPTKDSEIKAADELVTKAINKLRGNK